MKHAVSLLLLLMAPMVIAQESARYKLTEHAQNSGGSPVSGTITASTRFRVDPSSLGDGATRHSLRGVRFTSEAGFSLAYRPAGEVNQLLFAADHRTLRWSPEPAVGHYHVYRDAIGALSGLGYGTCLASAVQVAAYDDPSTPASGDGYFYLVTAANRLYREGSKGRSSAGTQRGNPTPCP